VSFWLRALMPVNCIYPPVKLLLEMRPGGCIFRGWKIHPLPMHTSPCFAATESTPAASPAAAPAAAAVVPVASPTPAVATPATPAAGAPPAAEPAPAARKGCCGGRRKAAPAKPAEPKVKFGELFRYSTPFDRAMMAIACVAAAGNGAWRVAA